MRRSDFIIKIVSLAAFCAVVFYIGYYLYNARTNPLRTALAVQTSAAESVSAEGYAVREERLVSADSTGAYVIVRDGDKVSAGESIAAVYSDKNAAERSEKIRTLRLKLDALTGLLGGKTASEAASETVSELAYAVRTGSISDLTELRACAETYIFGDAVTRGSEEIRAEIAETERQLSLTDSGNAGAKYVTANASGVFSSAADGYESVSPDALTDITRDGIKELFENAEALPAGTVGRLVTGLRWYFVTELPSETASELKSAKRAKVSFSKTYSRTLTMDVEYVGSAENGMRAVVLSSGEFIYETAGLRRLYGEVITSEKSGLKAPREALHIDEDGQTFVYVLVGLRAERANVSIVYESEDYYIVSAESGSRLSDGMEIIVSSGEIFDGKVIQG